jgi:hypothetical protein
MWRVIAEKHPEIWAVIGGDPSSVLALNPQPLPPRSAFLASVILEVTERMTDVCELADLIPRPGGERGNILVAGHVAKFVDDICGNGMRIRWPFPWPAPSWFNDSLSDQDLIVMGTQFQQCAAITWTQTSRGLLPMPPLRCSKPVPRDCIGTRNCFRRGARSSFVTPAKWDTPPWPPLSINQSARAGRASAASC